MYATPVSSCDLEHWPSGLKLISDKVASRSSCVDTLDDSRLNRFWFIACKVYIYISIHRQILGNNLNSVGEDNKLQNTVMCWSAAAVTHKLLCDTARPLELFQHFKMVHSIKLIYAWYKWFLLVQLASSQTSGVDCSAYAPQCTYICYAPPLTGGGGHKAMMMSDVCLSV